MRLEYETPYVRLYQGDSRRLPLEDGTVSCVVTSPPYMGLRKYQGDQDLIWDEPAEGCEHVWGEEKIVNATAWEGFHKYEIDGHLNPDVQKRNKQASQGRFCQRCRAWRGAFGREPSPDLYIRHLMTFMDELWRVLRADGVVFVNLGDSMAGSGNGSHDYRPDGSSLSQSRPKYQGQKPGLPNGLRPKSLMLIPERFALACQEQGWIVRSRIVWAKPNPMPESVRDRPTDAWEHIWMLTKSERYWWDQEAVREPWTDKNKHDTERALSPRQDYHGKHSVEKLTGSTGFPRGNPEQGRNLRNVWTIATEPFAEAHFATFPTAIPERCILAACPTAICTVCGVPRERIVERTGQINKREPAHVPFNSPTKTDSTEWKPTTRETGEWTDCGHDSWEPGLVLDPFSGAGTTAIVAQQLGRRAVGVDLSAAYIEMAHKRLESVPLPMVMEGECVVQ